MAATKSKSAKKPVSKAVQGPSEKSQRQKRRLLLTLTNQKVKCCAGLDFPACTLPLRNNKIKKGPP